MKVEVEAREIALKNSHGDIAIIPAKDVAWVKEKLEQGCHSCLDEYIDTLPMGKDYAQDGTVDPGDGFWKGLLQGVKRSANPKNWGKKDFSDSPNFDAAYESAKKSGNKEFIYKGNRFTTEYKGTPTEEMATYGILPDRAVANPSKIRRNFGNMTTDQGYDTPTGDLIKTAKGKIGWEYTKEEFDSYDYDETAAGTPQEQDALRMYLGLPQRGNTFRPSKYKEGSFELTKYSDKFPEEMPPDDYLDKWGPPIDLQNVLYEDIQTSGKLSEEEKKEVLEIAKQREEIESSDLNYQNNDVWRSLVKREKQLSGKVNPSGIKPYGDYVMGKHTVRKGEDEDGEFLEYIDKWDLDKIPGLDKINRPFSIYGRIYYKDYGDGKKKKVHYTDSQLKKISVAERNFNTLDLQKELSNRGYKLPNSTKKDGSFDGVWGEETEAALRDWQSKNK